MSDTLLFNAATWLVWLAPFVGIFAAAFTRRQDPAIQGDRVLRHDLAARIEHWAHGIGTAVLLLSGIVIGLKFAFMPSFVSSGPNTVLWMNIHFVAVVVFLFGTFYYGANTVLSWYRFNEHLPTKNAFKFTVQHYGKLLGFKFDMPPEDKYFESERMAFILALLATVVIIATGLIKTAAHAMSIPGSVMGVVTVTHDLATVLMLAFFLAHIFFAAILPMSWPVLGSMFTGFVTREHAEEEHAGWYARLTAGDAKADSDSRH